MTSRARRFTTNRVFLPLLGVLAFSACSSAPTPTPFIPPTASAPFIEPTFIINPTQNIAVIESTPLPTILPTGESENCVNGLAFVSDLTVADETVVTYGATIDKQWLVENNGTCDWNDQYRLRHIGGAALGAPEEIALFPARSGRQATIQIIFTAPFSDGEYESAWQAFDPFGLAFGDPIYMRIVVLPP